MPSDQWYPVFCKKFFHCLRICCTKLCCKVNLADTTFYTIHNIFIAESGCAMENQRNVYDFTNLTETFFVENRCSHIETMCSSDCNCKRCNSCTLYEFFCLSCGSVLVSASASRSSSLPPTLPSSASHGISSAFATSAHVWSLRCLPQNPVWIHRS